MNHPANLPETCLERTRLARDGTPSPDAAASRSGICRLLLVLIALGSLNACRTALRLPPANLGEPGWRVRQGQAIWRPKKDAPEIAGDLLVATHPDGRAFLQFAKTPLPLVVAQTTATLWQIQFAARNTVYQGVGEPPKRLIWLHLPRCLEGNCSWRDWSFHRLAGGRWHLENIASGEMVEGYLTPGLPASYAVRAGDTLWQIARRFGVTLQALHESNPQLNSNRPPITVGDLLVIPTP